MRIDIPARIFRAGNGIKGLALFARMGHQTPTTDASDMSAAVLVVQL
jgi:hypothetical protein